ncbi:branched-chain amino acid aminotransferase [Tistlia consotensis]|uniref:Probable branched-chain-amino-acid aminotransferase n=1 Tax=Tistlia consotensis USBA 355 TaxID=560819 RepID=A0A1Y6B6I6_9PROT|nr:aminotransferase class IV [Tistlia consotensis]SME87914.1 branched-chain amino acid aminotransferase [Tistlia consotensis USBA 355]SNR24235.1 branched-chain amino acid aminotransferase [Tistlia consotensis]
MSGSPERTAWFNGDFLPESAVRIPFRDRGFIHGDGVFDTARTFRGRIHKLEEHVARLYRSMAYLKLDCGLAPEQLISISRELVARNEPLRGAEGDWWVTQRVTRGVPAEGADDRAGSDRPTIIVECTPLPLARRAPLFRDGIDVVIPWVRRTPPESLSPRAKTQNYLNLALGQLEASAQAPEAWAVLLDLEGNLTEGIGCNVFLVIDGRLKTPRAQKVLPGITRETVMELAAELGIAVEETDLDPYDALTAEEGFLTSTSLCLCPIRSIDGRPLGGGKLPGTVTERLTRAFSESVQFDFVGQYLSHLAA